MKHYCVVSHTHWDREWYQTQEQFRIRLIDLFDNLLKILDKNPSYIFHMDAQTIVFEDYWEVRPEMKEKCCQYIREGRILAGPWYVQNDFFLTSGESTIRNLLIGTKQAEDMGRCGKTGYTPDQFGLISQLPQILRGFDIDHCVFGRGYYSFEEMPGGWFAGKNKPAEFNWESPDGSGVLAICMSFWYNNAQRFSADIDKAYRLTENIRDSFEGVATTPYLLLMNGVDHLEPQPDLLPILNEIQKRLPEDEKIYQTSLENYAELVRGAKIKEEMPTEVGELMQGTTGNLLKDTVSSRVYLKTKNCELQNMLENCLEPLYALLELSGMNGVYPSGHLDYLWKMLIRNHAHDSICGCSTDAVHRHMEDRFENIEEMGKELLRRGMKQLAAHVHRDLAKEDYQIVVFNSLEKSRTEVIDAVIDVVAEDEPQGIRITDENGMEVPFLVLDTEKLAKSVFSPINLPGMVDTVRYKVRILAENVPAFGFVSYRVETNHETTKYEFGNTIGFEQKQEYCLENNNLKVTVSANGTVNLFHKESGHIFEDVLRINDSADAGEAYNYLPLAGDVPVDVSGFIPAISIEETDSYLGRLRMHYEVTLPAYLDKANRRRSEETVTMPLDIILTLKKEAKSLDVTFVFTNKAKEHRMRALVRTGLNCDMAVSTSPFDLIARNKWDIKKQICNETEHNSGMTAIGDEKLSVAILNRGIYGYENLQSEQGTLAFALVRSTGKISAGDEACDDEWAIPENQCLREIRCEFSILPQTGGEFAEKAAFEAKSFQNPMMVQCEPVDTHKFMGGRTAVQDTGIAEIFYQDVPYGDITLARSESGIALEGKGLQVTALKKSFDRTGYVLRFFNMKEVENEAVIRFNGLAVKRVWKTNMKENAREEIAIADHTVVLAIRAKEIVTLFFK